MAEKLKSINVFKRAQMNMEMRGASIVTLHASQSLRHVCITVNQLIHFQVSFEPAQYVSVCHGVTPNFYPSSSGLKLCDNTLILGSSRE